MAMPNTLSVAKVLWHWCSMEEGLIMTKAMDQKQEGEMRTLLALQQTDAAEVLEMWLLS